MRHDIKERVRTMPPRVLIADQLSPTAVQIFKDRGISQVPVLDQGRLAGILTAIATFLILGQTCTRDCGFCAVEHGTPAPPDESEPDRIAGAVRDTVETRTSFNLILRTTNDVSEGVVNSTVTSGI